MWAKLKHLLWQWRGVWLAAPGIAGLVILLRMLGLLQSWEWASFDQYMRQRPLEPTDNRIVIVGIDEADLQKIGQANVPDGDYAKLLQKLKAMQPRAIGLDIYRDLPVEPGHQELVRVFESTPNLVGIQKVVGDRNREAVAPSPVLKAKKQVGANDLLLDADNKVRRSFIYVAEQDGQNVFSFGFYLALLYLDAEGIVPQEVAGTKTKWKLGKTEFVPLETNDGGYVRADAGGYQLLLNYRGPSRHFHTVPMRDILENRVSPDWGRDRIILIGAVGESIQDLYFIPYSSRLLTLPQRMAGVEIHANFSSQILSAALDDRPFIKTWSEPCEWLWILLWSGVGATLSWKWRYADGISKFSFRTAGPFLASGVLLGSTYAAFLAGWWLPVVPPFLALAGSAIAITGYIARTAGQIRKTFGRYLSDQIVATLLESPEGLKLGGERRKISILTSDLRGFTARSEGLSPEDVVKILNVYLGYMADVITNYQGTIDEFMGDGILVLFGAPTLREDDAQRAVACAIAMQLAMVPLNELLKEWNLPKLEMGIAINTGEVVVGNIGSDKRTKYGVVGNQVNITYRIESYTVGGQILISESTFQEVETIIRINGQREEQAKGLRQPIKIYEVGGIGGTFDLFLTKQEEVFFSLFAEIPLRYVLLDGKHVDTTLFKGSLVKLSSRQAEIRSYPVEEYFVPLPMSNIKLNFLSGSQVDSEDIYAKVLDRQADKGNFYVHFTTTPSNVQARLDALYNLLKGKT